MDVDLSALKALERDKEISMEVLLSALGEALLNAYDKTPGAIAGARVDIDRRSGKVSVLAPELDEEGNKIGEFDHTPEGFGRVAAATARQVIFQRSATSQARRATFCWAWSSRTAILGWCESTWAASRRSCRPPNRFPARTTATESGCGSSW